MRNILPALASFAAVATAVPVAAQIPEAGEVTDPAAVKAYAVSVLKPEDALTIDAALIWRVGLEPLVFSSVILYQKAESAAGGICRRNGFISSLPVKETVTSILSLSVGDRCDAVPLSQFARVQWHHHNLQVSVRDEAVRALSMVRYAQRQARDRKLRWEVRCIEEAKPSGCSRAAARKLAELDLTRIFLIEADASENWSFVMKDDPGSVFVWTIALQQSQPRILLTKKVPAPF